MRFRIVAACLCSLGIAGCPVDERRLAPHPGLQFFGGEAGEGGDGGDGGDGSGGTAAQPNAGEGGDGGSDHTGGIGAGHGGSASGGAGRSGNGGNTAGSAQAGSGGNAGVGAQAGTGGTAGCGASSSCGGEMGGMGGEVVGRCPDLDDDGVLDCDETVVVNPSFDLNPDGWAPELNLSVAWSEVDALGHDDSGSLEAANEFEADMDGTLMVGARQCLTVVGGATYHYYAQALVPEDSGGTEAGIQVLYHDNVQCTGVTIGVAASNRVDGPDWGVVSVTEMTPFGAKSATVRLVVVKPYRQPPVPTLFDNVLVRIR